MKDALRYAGLLLAAACGVAAADVADFARYDVILERKPFGDVQVQAAQKLTAEQVQKSFIKDLRLCAIYEGDEGIRVGLVYLKSTPPTSFILRLDETSDDGIKLVDADYETGTALLRKENEEYWIVMGNELSVATGGGAPPQSATAAIGGAPGAPRESYAERLRKRREALRAPPTEPPKLTGEDLRKHLEQYQMDLIRSGGEKGPPLPIPLTPEMDDQLVKEGVLPPAQ